MADTARSLDTPLGRLTLVARGGVLVSVRWGDSEVTRNPPDESPGRAGTAPVKPQACIQQHGRGLTSATGDTDGDDDLIDRAAMQITEYFSGEREAFDLPLAPTEGTLQARVQSAMSAIPFGQTRTYGDIARTVGAPAQAVGQACGANPLPILIPCHRVLGSTGLGGYSGRGGVETKVALLRLEGAASLLL